MVRTNGQQLLVRLLSDLGQGGEGVGVRRHLQTKASQCLIKVPSWKAPVLKRVLPERPVSEALTQPLRCMDWLGHLPSSPYLVRVGGSQRVSLLPRTDMYKEMGTSLETTNPVSKLIPIRKVLTPLF